MDIETRPLCDFCHEKPKVKGGFRNGRPYFKPYCSSCRRTLNKDRRPIGVPPPPKAERPFCKTCGWRRVDVTDKWFRDQCWKCRGEKYKETSNSPEKTAAKYARWNSKARLGGITAEQKLQPCKRCGFIPEDSCQIDVDHIDGNHENNASENLQILCVNCHRIKTKAFCDRGAKKNAHVHREKSPLWTVREPLRQIYYAKFIS